jgi:hypothetical protein
MTMTICCPFCGGAEIRDHWQLVLAHATCQPKPSLRQHYRALDQRAKQLGKEQRRGISASRLSFLAGKTGLGKMVDNLMYHAR